MPEYHPPPKVLLPSLNNISPRLMDGFAQAQAEHELRERAIARGDLSPRLTIRTRQDRRPVPLAVRRAARKLWRSDVKNWCTSQAKAVDLVQRNERQEQVIDEWFNALDMDRSGTIEENEVQALMVAMGVDPNPKVIRHMFEAIGKTVTSRLTRQDFIKFVTANASALSSPAFTSPDGGADNIFDPNMQLMMMAYRRQRLIEEAQNPANRSHFRDVQSFNERYRGRLGRPVEPEDSLPKLPEVPPHPMSMLPNLSARGSSRQKQQWGADGAFMQPRPPPQPRAPSSMLAPPPPKIVPDSFVMPPDADAIGAASLAEANAARTSRLGSGVGAAPLPAITPAPAVASWDEVEASPPTPAPPTRPVLS